MFKFWDLKREAFALDISGSSLKIVRLKKKQGSFYLSSFGWEKLEDGVIEEGVIKNEKLLVKSLKSAYSKVEGEKLDTKYAIVSLPEEESFSQVIQMPIMSQDELKSAIQFQIENYIPLPIEDVYLDFQIIPAVKDSLDHIDVLIVAIPKKIVDSYLSCSEQAGLIPIVFEVKPQAIVRALIKDEVSQKPLVLINFEGDRADMVVFSGHCVRFTCSILSPSNLENFVLQIKKYIDFYEEHASHEHLFFKSQVEKIVLCGDSANLKTLPEYLSSQLKISAELGNPFINFPSKPKNFSVCKEPLFYTVALGLALRGIDGLPA